MTKQISFYLLFFIAFLGCTDSSGSTNGERYVSKEIIIGKYDYKDGQPLIGKDDMRWWKVESDHITVDDLKRVFVLDAYNSRILQYSPEGIPTRVINLKNTKIYAGNPDLDGSNIDDSGMDTGIIVNRDGRYFYVLTDEFKWTAFYSSGDPIRQKEIIPTTISLNRLCDDKLITNYEVMDAQFNVLSKLTYPLRVQNDYPISEDVREG